MEKCIAEIGPHSNNHSIVVTNHAAGTTLLADQARLEQVLLNLLSNAIKYSPKSGEVQVIIEKKRSKLRIAVCDSGVGIPKIMQQTIFQRFFRVENTANHYPGMGVGLFISQEIIKRHNGLLLFEARKGVAPHSGLNYLLSSTHKKRATNKISDIVQSFN